MLKLTELSLSLSNRLQPLRDALSSTGIPVSYLPKEAGKYGDADETGTIDLILSRVSSSLPRDLTSYRFDLMPIPEQLNLQDFNYKVFVQINLRKLYTNLSIEKEVVEECADQVCNLLCGYSPIAGSTPLYFESYVLSEPSNDRWQALLTFAFLVKRSPSPISDLNPQEITVKIYNSLTLSGDDAVLLKEMIIPPEAN